MNPKHPPGPPMTLGNMRELGVQTPDTRKRSERGYFTQWAAQFAVASELCKRGYVVSFTMGNTTPIADLMVVSPQGKMFLIDVKGLYRINPWLVKCKPVQANLFYALAFVPSDTPNRFFVISQSEIDSLIRSELKRLNRPDDYPVTGISMERCHPTRKRMAHPPRITRRKTPPGPPRTLGNMRELGIGAFRDEDDRDNTCRV
jgi:hypothetical protein